MSADIPSREVLDAMRSARLTDNEIDEPHSNDGRTILFLLGVCLLLIAAFFGMVILMGRLLYTSLAGLFP